MKSVGVWEKHALQWKHVGAPLRPAKEDIEHLERVVAEQCAVSGGVAPRVVLLGVTPEIAAMRWAEGTHLLAVDCNPAMIENVWARGKSAEAEAVCANWNDIPVGNASRDAVVGDGCFSLYDYPDGYETLNLEVLRVLKRNGCFVIRAFIRPDKSESLDTVFDDLQSGRIGNFHVFKWRLAMALHRKITEGVRLGDIWDAWSRAVPEPDALAEKLGWRAEAVRTIDAYRGLDTRYTFPRLEEFRRAMSAHFSEASCFFPDYELGERCPTMVFRPR